MSSQSWGQHYLSAKPDEDMTRKDARPTSLMALILKIFNKIVIN